MRYFFQGLRDEDRADPKSVAQQYGKHLWTGRSWTTLTRNKTLSRSRYYVGLSSGTSDFVELTKRTTLVTDTLLLSNNWVGEYHQLTIESIDYAGAAAGAANIPVIPQNRTEIIWMTCPDLGLLGRWMLDAEPLLTAGLVWYLPSFSWNTYRTSYGEPSREAVHWVRRAVDYLVQDGRAVDTSNSEPIKSQLIRPVLHADLPFIQGVELRDFSKITVEEFDSYRAFRDFLRQSLLDLDDCLDDVQSERALLKLGLQINEGIRATGAEMAKTHRKRAMAASGAVLGTTGAVLVAVYGPALASAIAAIGASGGVWGVINAMAEHNPRTLRENKWYYVWVLATKRDV